MPSCIRPVLLAAVCATSVLSCGVGDVARAARQARRSYHETIIRANLITLADAESSYSSTHGHFAGSLKLLKRPDGTPFRLTPGVSVAMTVSDGGTWEATGTAVEDTTVVCLIRMVARGAVARRTQTHCPRFGATRVRLAGGISLSLPLSWAIRDSAGLARWSEEVDSAVKSVDERGDSNGAPRGRIFLVAHGPGGAVLTVASSPAPETTPRSFANLTAAEREEYRARLCERLTGVARAATNVSVRCGRLQVDSIRDRDALVFETEVDDGEAPLHAWSLLAATTDVIVTLSFEAPLNRADDYEPIFRRIWRSLSVPERLGPTEPAAGRASRPRSVPELLRSQAKR